MVLAASSQLTPGKLGLPPATPQREEDSEAGATSNGGGARSKPARKPSKKVSQKPSQRQVTKFLKSLEGTTMEDRLDLASRWAEQHGLNPSALATRAAVMHADESCRCHIAVYLDLPGDDPREGKWMQILREVTAGLTVPRLNLMADHNSIIVPDTVPVRRLQRAAQRRGIMVYWVRLGAGAHRGD